MVAADPIARAQNQAAIDDAKRSGGKRKWRTGGGLKRFHNYWDTIPMHCIDLVSGRSSIDDESPEQIWDYLKQSTAILEWRSECPSTALLALI